MHCSSRDRSHWRVCARWPSRFRGSGIFDFGCASWSVIHISPMSAIGPKRTSLIAPHMSAFGGKADMTGCRCLLSRSLLGVKRTSLFAAHMSACDPKRTWLSDLPELDYGPSWKACVSYQELRSCCAAKKGSRIQWADSMSDRNFSRHDVGTLAWAATMTASSATTTCAQTAQRADMARSAPRQFPNGFFWGTGTSSYQIEGAWNEDGKGPSIWDTYAHTSGNIKNGDTGDVANDHYHRYKQDVALMKNFGANAYRFSVAWPRIFPTGTGQPNPKGLDFYNRLVDELVAAGIAPFATLYHWELPQTLQDKGGWQNRDTVNAFADYTGYMTEKLSDRVRHFFTINEFRTFVDLGHQVREVMVAGGTVPLSGAPGLKLPPGDLNQVRHHAVLAHGMAVQAIRAKAKAGTKVGPAEVILCSVPLIESPEHIKAAQIATREVNAPFLTVMLEGKYTDAYLRDAGKDAPKFTDDDLKIIASPLDFVGINV